MDTNTTVANKPYVLQIALDDATIGIIELISLSICCINATMFGILMWKTKTLHLHLRLIFLSMTIATYGECITRVWLTALEIFLPTYKSLLQEVVNICPGLLAAYFTFVEISIAVERLMATFYVKTYENSHSSAMYLNIGIPWFVLIVTYYMASYHIIINFIYFAYSLFVIDLFAWACFIILYLSNRKMYSIAKTSVKYQLSENVRTTKQLMIYVIFKSTMNLVSIFYILIQVYYFIPNQMWLSIRIIQYAYRLYLAFFFGTYPFVLIYFHKDMRKLFRSRILRIKSGMKIFNKSSSKNVIGQQLYTNFEELNYFQQLEQQWEYGLERLEKKSRRVSVNPSTKSTVFPLK